MVLWPSTGASSLSGTGLSPPLVGLSSAFPLDKRFVTPRTDVAVPSTPQPRTRNAHTLTRVRFRLFPFRSPLLRKSFLFLGVLRCFSSPRAPRHAYVFSMRYPGIPLGGFPHSDISGSSLVGSSPKLFAAYYVLLRPLAPRHPPCALSSLIAFEFRRTFAFCSVFKVHGPWPNSLALRLRRCPSGPRSTSRASRLVKVAIAGNSIAINGCGDEGIRTPDLLRAREALSQLSYVPLTQWAFLDLNQRPFPYQRNALAD
jgi:hypothetical protein